MKTKINKIIVLLAALLMIVCLAACSGKDSGIDFQAALKDMYKTQTELGLSGKYERFADIKDGQADPELTGTWFSADKDVKVVFDGSGKMTYTSVTYDSTVVAPYTCITSGKTRMIAEEQTYTAYVNDVEKEETALSFSTYSVKNGVLLMVSVEPAPDDNTTQYMSALQVFYKADASGSIEASLQSNPISLRSFYGTWTSGSGEKTIKIDKKGLTMDSVTYALSIDDKGNLCVGDPGNSTAYSFNLMRINTYEDGTNKKLEKKTIGIGFYYDGKDKNDRPNLADAMTDWNAEFGYEGWHYSGQLEMKVK